MVPWRRRSSPNVSSASFPLSVTRDGLCQRLGMRPRGMADSRNVMTCASRSKFNSTYSIFAGERVARSACHGKFGKGLYGSCGNETMLYNTETGRWRSRRTAQPSRRPFFTHCRGPHSADQPVIASSTLDQDLSAVGELAHAQVPLRSGCPGEERRAHCARCARRCRLRCRSGVSL